MFEICLSKTTAGVAGDLYPETKRKFLEKIESLIFNKKTVEFQLILLPLELNSPANVISFEEIWDFVNTNMPRGPFAGKLSERCFNLKPGSSGSSFAIVCDSARISTSQFKYHESFAI